MNIPRHKTINQVRSLSRLMKAISIPFTRNIRLDDQQISLNGRWCFDYFNAIGTENKDGGARVFMSFYQILFDSMPKILNWFVKHPDVVKPRGLIRVSPSDKILDKNPNRILFCFVGIGEKGTSLSLITDMNYTTAFSMIQEASLDVIQNLYVHTRQLIDDQKYIS